MKRIWRFFWPLSFVSQMVLVVLLSLSIAQAILFHEMSGAHKSVYRQQQRTMWLTYMANLASTVEYAPLKQQQRICNELSSHNGRFSIDDSPVVKLSERQFSPDFRYLKKQLVRVYSSKNKLKQFYVYSNRWDRPSVYLKDGDTSVLPSSISTRYSEDRSFLKVSIHLTNGQWLNLKAHPSVIPPILAKQTVWTLVVAGCLLLIGVILMVWRIARPLKALANAAHDFGIGKPIDPVKVSGPKDTRETIQAFNQMHERLKRYMEDRVRMLAVLSHDLRTPITTLRLRLELMEDISEKDELLEALDEMQAISESTLSFVRETTSQEKTDKCEVNTLVSAVCNDFSDTGKPVTFENSDSMVIACKPVSIRRALRNLIDNALKYGNEAHVLVYKTASGEVSIAVEDKGPGIPLHLQDKIFEPFVRLEGSRNKVTGGIGLGMSITRAIIHNHGGSISLHNQVEGGLKVSITLPKI